MQPELKKLYIPQSFELESGQVLPDLEIVYHTFGHLNAAADNVVWVCHALTANSDAADWWSGLIGQGKLLDPSRYFIVCANMLGSSYGSTSPLSIHPDTGVRYGKAFPLITIRDIVAAHRLLQAHLGIRKIKLALGGSMGGQQVLEWAIADPGLMEQICLMACNARHTAWGIAFNETQRMAIEADQTLWTNSPNAGARGLEAARAIAMLSYRNYVSYNHSQTDLDERIMDFRAGSYQRYQGLKLSKRFHAWSYLSLSRSMDSHDVGRGRGGVEAALAGIQAKTLVVGIQSDILFPIEEQATLASGIPGARLEVIDSPYGHDGFLIEYEKLSVLLRMFMEESAEKAGARA